MITGPATVAKIAAVINGLRQLPDGSYSCPADANSTMMLTSMRLTFRAVPGGPIGATVGADCVDCQFAWVSADSQTVGPLDENTSSGQSMQQQVLSTAGVRWPCTSG